MYFTTTTDCNNVINRKKINMAGNRVEYSSQQYGRLLEMFHFLLNSKIILHIIYVTRIYY